MEFPSEFTTKMKDLLGSDYEAWQNCYNEPRLYGLRVNTNKISPDEFSKIAPFELKRIAWIPNGFYYDGDNISPAKHPYYYAGLYYLQEPSAMTPANTLMVSKGEKVLDLCAAPGGKSTEVGAALKGEGVLVANDISASRCRALLKNIELSGIGNSCILCETPEKLAMTFPEYFDKILLDAPCSGEGMFRKEPKMIGAWKEHGPDYFCKIQKGLILKAAEMLISGGLLVYSTCTFDRKENEEVIDYLLEERPEFEVKEINYYEGYSKGIASDNCKHPDELRKTIRLFPHKLRGEGHFIALLKKEKIADASVNPGKCDENHHGNIGNKKNADNFKIPQEVIEFFEGWGEEFINDVNRVILKGNHLLLLPENINTAGLRALRTGLLLGECKKGRFEPSQALAMAIKKDRYPNCLNFSADDPRVIRYLKGETLEMNTNISKMIEPGTDSGETVNGNLGSCANWKLICVDSYPLGFAKETNGLLKNKYLAGWRML